MMDRYLIALVATDKQEGLEFHIQHVIEECREKLCGLADRCLVTLVHPWKDCQAGPEEEQVAPPVAWTDVVDNQRSVKELLATLTQLPDKPEVEDNDKSEDEVLGEQLHTIADSLPSGAVVDVVWFISHGGHEVKIMSYLHLFGALKRLREWHNSHLTLVYLDSLAAWSAPWISTLHASCVEICQLTWLNIHYTWRGRINIVNNKAQKCAALNGFGLQMCPQTAAHLNITVADLKDTAKLQSPLDDAMVMSRQLEFLEEIRKDTIPSAFITQHKYNLCITSSSKQLKKSRAFLARLNENPQMCYLVRLEYSTVPQTEAKPQDKKAKEAESKLSTTTCWKEKLSQDLNNISDFEENLQGPTDYFHLLLVGCGVENECVAHLLHPVSSINGALALDLAQKIEPPLTPDMEKRARELLSQVPCISSNQLLQWEGNLQLLQVRVLKKWIEEKCEDSVISCNELLGVIQEVRTTYNHLVDKQLTNSKPDLDLNENTKVQLITPKSDVMIRLQSKGTEATLRYFSSLTQSSGTEAEVLLEDSSEWAERLSLQHRSKARKKLDKHHSTDSLAGQAPPPRDQPVMLHVKEFLKFFKRDGTPALSNLQPISLPKARVALQKHNSEEMKTTAWPASLTCHYHDMYYNSDAKCEATEATYSRVRSHYLRSETVSSCNYEQVHSPAVLPRTNSSATSQVPRPPSKLAAAPSSSTASWDEEKRGRPLREDDKTNRDGRRDRRRGEEMQPEKKRKLQEIQPSQAGDGKREAKRLAAEAEAASKETRSQRHKRKLEEVVAEALKSHGITSKNSAYKSCFARLYTLSKGFVKDLQTSRNLREEMKKIADGLAPNVVQFEAMRMLKSS